MGDLPDPTLGCCPFARYATQTYPPDREPALGVAATASSPAPFPDRNSSRRFRTNSDRSPRAQSFPAHQPGQTWRTAPGPMPVLIAYTPFHPAATLASYRIQLDGRPVNHCPWRGIRSRARGTTLPSQGVYMLTRPPKCVNRHLAERGGCGSCKSQSRHRS